MHSLRNVCDFELWKGIPKLFGILLYTEIFDKSIFFFGGGNASLKYLILGLFKFSLSK